MNSILKNKFYNEIINEQGNKGIGCYLQMYFIHAIFINCGI